MKVLTAQQMREVDRLTTERCGIPSLQLMENAGAAVLIFLLEQFGRFPNWRFAVLCGKGNNGGDGLVVSRLLRERERRVEVFLFARPESVEGDAAVQLRRWQEMSGPLHCVTTSAEWQAVRGRVVCAQVVVDALLGTGLRRPVEGLLREVIGDLNAESRAVPPRRYVVAVDTPSGLPSDGETPPGDVLAADYTITFTAPKLGQVSSSRSSCTGRLLVRSIGTPPGLVEEVGDDKLRWLEPGEFRRIPLRRRWDAHKGDFGHALIVAGSRGKTGAAVLAGRAALRAGAGLVTVATPEDVLPTVAAGLPEMMTAPLGGTDSGSISLASLEYGRFAELIRGKNVLAMGPGLSTHQETQQFVRKIIADCALPSILDADGLNAFAGHAGELARRKASALVVTPHPGEMARLLECSIPEVQSDRLATARNAAKRWNAYVILKGHRTIVATPDGRAFVNSTGNPGMATAGTGDVLTGILAGLTAQFGVADWEKILGFGVYLHGRAGDLAAVRFGEAPLIASDLIADISHAFYEARVESQCEH